MTSENATEKIFECKMCGQCCKGFGGTYVTPENIEAICKYIQEDPETFIEKFCDPSGSRHVLTRGEDGCCIFFDPKKQCTIHPVKPYMCRAWPFLEAVVKHPENWEMMAGSCPGIITGIAETTLKETITREIEKLGKKKR